MVYRAVTHVDPRTKSGALIQPERATGPELGTPIYGIWMERLAVSAMDCSLVSRPPLVLVVAHTLGWCAVAAACDCRFDLGCGYARVLLYVLCVRLLIGCSCVRVRASACECVSVRGLVCCLLVACVGVLFSACILVLFCCCIVVGFILF